MNNKTLILLGAILLGLLVIAIIPTAFKKENSIPEELKNVSVDISDFSKETVSKVTFGKQESKKTLSVASGEWFINNEKADQDKVTLFFNDIQNAKVLKASSKNTDNHKKFEVTPEEGITLVFTRDGEEEEFYIGKQGPGFDTFYIRKKGIKNVYLMESALFGKLSWIESEWKEEQKQNEEAEMQETIFEE